MTSVLSAEIAPSDRRIGVAVINHEGLLFDCDICIYKNAKIWIRMPEFWVKPDLKKRVCNWDSQKLSDEKQAFMVSKILDMLELDLERALKIQQDFLGHKKELTREKNKLTLNQERSED